jgi:hypothetical protein
MMDGMGWHEMAWDGMAWHGMAWHGMGWDGQTETDRLTDIHRLD